MFIVYFWFMNKHRRHELKMLKYKKRLRNLRIKEKEGGNYFSFRSHGSPCSCEICSHDKYKRTKEKYSSSKEIREGVQEFTHIYDGDWVQDEIIFNTMYG